MGKVTVVSWPNDANLAIAMAEIADTPVDWPALGRVELGPVRLIVVPDEVTFSRMSRGQVPQWGVGLAFPGSGTIVLRADDVAIRSTLQHELAHIALHAAVDVRVPLWFDEGYAAWAAGEFGRLENWGLNLAVIRGRVPTLGELDAALRGSSHTAASAYALAMSAVVELAHRNPSRTLAPLLQRLRAGTGFEAAVIATTGFPLDRFDTMWRASVKRRYGWLTWLAAGGMWLVLGGVVVVAHWYRRRRDLPRRVALDQGWEVADDWRLEEGSGIAPADTVPGEGHSPETDQDQLV